MANSPDHRQRFYYGAGCKPSQEQGKLALETWTISPHSNMIEIQIGIRRPDIGRIEMKDCRINQFQDWITVWDETKSEEWNNANRHRYNPYPVDGEEL